VQSIRHLLSRPAGKKLLDAQSCLDWVLEINTAYRALYRPGQQAQEIVDLKLSVIFWRSRLLHRLLSRPPDWVRAQPEDAVRIFLEINTFLAPDQQKRASGLLPPQPFARLMANQGSTTPGFPELDHQAGPDVHLDIVANRGSSWPYEKWRENDSFGRYAFENDGVRYRGMSFRPGDALLANVNVDGNGVYTSLSEPRSFSSHSGFFAILEHKGRRLPVVVETYEKGVRPVPLSIFLGPRFCSYVEIYRHTGYTARHAARINESAEAVIRNGRAYNFNSEDKDPDYMSCTAVGRYMHQAGSLAPARRISSLSHPVVQKNLARVGYCFFDYFGPVDFLLNDCFKMTGVVDNNQIERLLAREMIDQEFRRKFIMGNLDPKRFPFPYRLNLWGLGQMRRQTPIGKLVGRIEGFSADTLPKGPDALLAVILLAEKQIGKSIVKARATVEKVLAEYQHLDMKAFAADQRIQHAVRQSLNLPWLQPAEAVVERHSDCAPRSRPASMDS
jgi:hypothetical protein